MDTGNTMNQVIEQAVSNGSAPWIRGTHSSPSSRLHMSRFSPVDTGNTIVKIIRCIPFPVQPRGYGEHFRYGLHLHQLRGSAPWIRGTLAAVEDALCVRRFSPVDTGNTIRSDRRSKICAVQPRGYGEHNSKNYPVHSIPGSAPWIRGTLQVWAASTSTPRFSPVDTGNTN